jgi:hypothetical protein
MKDEKMYRFLLIWMFFQGVYYTVTGLWPLVHMPSFLSVTGPKTDLWLVRMVGLLAFANGVCMLYSRFTREFPPVLFVLTGASALAFAAIDVYYVLAGTIRPVYLGDALAEIIFFLLSLYFIINYKRIDRIS